VVPLEVVGEWAPQTPWHLKRRHGLEVRASICAARCAGFYVAAATPPVWLNLLVGRPTSHRDSRHARRAATHPGIARSSCQFSTNFDVLASAHNATSIEVLARQLML